MTSLEIRIDQNKLCHTKLESSGTAFVRQIKVRREESLKKAWTRSSLWRQEGSNVLHGHAWLPASSESVDWPKTYCESNTGVFDGKQVVWSEINWTTVHLFRAQLKAQTTDDSCSKSISLQHAALLKSKDSRRRQHLMVLIMLRPISTQQWAWSSLGSGRPDTQ